MGIKYTDSEGNEMKDSPVFVLTSEETGLKAGMLYEIPFPEEQVTKENIDMYNGQDGVDKWLHENGYLDEPGFFVDLGSSHPVNNNNTYFLEQNGWRGICIDADARVQPFYQQMRTDTIFELAIATDKAGVVTYFLSPMQEASGLNDTLGDGTPVQAEATTLTVILKKHKVKAVDALFVDVEGHEAEALKGFDFKKWQPRIVVIEHTAFGNRSEEAKELLEKKGYALAHETTFNYIFTR